MEVTAGYSTELGNSAADLISRSLEGNQSAFSELVSIYQQGVYKLAYSFFNDGDEAMEIVQETFLRVYQKLDKFKIKKSGTSFKGWIHRIAYNLCVDSYRKYKKYNFDENAVLESVSESDPQHSDELGHFEKQHMKHKLRKLIMVLSRRQKQVFILKHYSGFKFIEISEMMGISVGTVKSLHFRATKTLEKKLSHIGGLT